MKRILLTLFVLGLISNGFAQSPEKISYQAVIRNLNNELIANQSVSLKISIIKGSATGITVYSETQNTNTNSNGLISVEIGTGNTLDNFSTIDWAGDSYFIQTEIDPSGGINYSIKTVSQLLSVPYALHAKTAEFITNDYGYITSETDPVYLSSQASNITASDINKLNNLTGINTGDQDLSNLATQSALEDSASAIRGDISELSGFVVNEEDPVYSASQASNITASDISKLSNLTGINTGDQNLSNLATQSALEDSASAIRDDMPDLTGFVETEEDPVYSESQASNITASDINKLSNLTGINTGDQDLSNLATRSALIDTAAALRSSMSSNEHYIGELYGGGIVFWVTPEGDHGLIASLDDLGDVVAWSATSAEIGSAARSMTDGIANTAAIVSQNNTSGYAATLCASYSGGGYTDWFLPSCREMFLLGIQDYLIDRILDNDGNSSTNGFIQEYGTASHGRYWCSTEYPTDPSMAFLFNFFYNRTAIDTKNSQYRVRAVRAF